MVICFIAKNVLIERGKLLKVICQLDVKHNWLSKLPKKSLDKKLLLFSIQGGLQSSKLHKMAPLLFLD
jgi:hypothetical protein